MKKNFLVLILILFLAAVLRLPFLSQIPAGFSGDEAVTGYSAYSILKTGRDEWGDLMPITFRSFGDYKPGLYTYLTIPSIAVFGLNEFATRLPAAIIGVLGVLVVYFLAQMLFKNPLLSAVSSLLLAVSPWHIHFSRIAFEGGLTAFLFPAGLLFYLKAAEKQKFLPLAVIFWGLNLLSYLPARLFTLLMVFVVVLLKKPKKLKIKTKIFTAVTILITVVLLIFASRMGSLNRFLDISIFSTNLEPLKQIQFESPLPRNVTRIFDNKVIFYTTKFFENYLSYFSPTFLFTGSRPESSYLNMPGAPLLFGVEIIFLISAAFFAFQNPSTFPIIFLLWLILAPIPAAFTKDMMNLHRATTFLPLFSIMSAYGAVNLVASVKEKFKLNLTPLLLVVILAASIHFLQIYFLHLPQKPPESARYGYRQAIAFTESVKDNYERIIFTKYNSEPQAFVAFYTKTDPVFYQSEAADWLRFETEGKKYLDQLPEYSLGKYEFRDTIWDDVKNLKNALIVAAPRDIPDSIHTLKTIKDPTGKVIFKIVESLGKDQPSNTPKTEIRRQVLSEETTKTSVKNFAKIVRVIDGDTVKLETGESLRYIGINAPERGKCFYNEAKNKNRELVEGKIAEFAKDVSEADKYGRLLRFVYLDPTTASGQAIFVNEVLVREGYARAYPYPPDLTLSAKFSQAENLAREQNLGIWKYCINSKN